MMTTYTRMSQTDHNSTCTFNSAPCPQDITDEEDQSSDTDKMITNFDVDPPSTITEEEIMSINNMEDDEFHNKYTKLNHVNIQYQQPSKVIKYAYDLMQILLALINTVLVISALSRMHI